MAQQKELKVQKILSTYYKEVLKQVEKVKSKAHTLGVAEPIIEFSDFYTHVYTDPEITQYSGRGVEEVFAKFEIEVFDLVIRLDETLKFNGWEPIAYLDYKDKVFIQMDIEKDYDYDFQAHLQDELTCEHCEQKRQRRNVWVLQHEQTGEFKKVGSSCINDFTGVDPSKFLKMFQFIDKKLDEFSDEEYGAGGSVAKNPENYLVFEVDEVLTLARHVIDQDEGFIKAEKEFNEDTKEFERTNLGEATSDKVQNILFHHYLGKESSLSASYFLPLGYVDHEYVNNVRQFLLNIEPRMHPNENPYDERQEIPNSFDQNLKELGSKTRVRRFDVGLISYVPQAYNNYLEKLNQPVSEHVGEVGQKVALELTVKMVKEIDGFYGPTTLYKMVDDQGNQFAKFGRINEKYIVEGESPGGQVDEGTKVKFTAEVKKHNEFKGTKETILGKLLKCKDTEKVVE